MDVLAPDVVMVADVSLLAPRPRTYNAPMLQSALVVIALVSSCVGLGCGCGGAGETVAPVATAAPAASTPTGRIKGYECEASGDYVQADVLAAVRAEAAAWQACADAIVKPVDPVTSAHVVFGDLAFSWTLAGGAAGDEHITTAGDGRACVRAIVERLKATPPFQGKTAGKVSCVAHFDDSTAR